MSNKVFVDIFKVSFILFFFGNIFKWPPISLQNLSSNTSLVHKSFTSGFISSTPWYSTQLSHNSAWDLIYNHAFQTPGILPSIIRFSFLFTIELTIVLKLWSVRVNSTGRLIKVRSPQERRCNLKEEEGQTFFCLHCSHDLVHAQFKLCAKGLLIQQCICLRTVSSSENAAVFIYLKM